ncbi:MAG: hypothetical protein U1E26_03235 [Coriobacteriia bacterium]|nr:hypothetical protein [Coriobacteriia bacterium]
MPENGDAVKQPEDAFAVVSDAAALQARVEQLEAENAQLRQKTIAPTAAPRSGRGRNAGAIVMALVAALLISASVPAVWLNRMMTDTDVFVATMAPLAQDADIQNAVATKASEAIIEQLDAVNRIRPLLPEELQLIATPVAQAVNGFIEKQAYALVRSEQFAVAWERIIRASHKAIITAVTGRDTGAFGAKAGVFTLDVGTLADEIRARLQAAGMDFVANIPTSAIDKQIVLYESPVLAQMTPAFDLLSRVAFWLPPLGLALAGGAVALAIDRRKVILWLGGGLTLAAILPLQAFLLGQTYVAGQLYQLSAIPEPAAQAAFEIIFRDLVTSDRSVAALGIVLFLGALAAGPARWAVAVRTGLSGGIAGVASHLELGRFGEWVSARKHGLRWTGAGLLLALLLVLPAPRTVASIVTLGVLFVVWVLLVELFGASPVQGPIADGGVAEADDAEPVA